MADKVARAEKKAAKKGADAAKAARLAAIDEEIYKARQERRLGGISLTRQKSEAGDLYRQKAGDTRQDAGLHRAFSTRGSAGRGIALSGVRFGNDARISRDLTKALGQQAGDYNRQLGALQEQRSALRARARTTIRSARNERRGLTSG